MVRSRDSRGDLWLVLEIMIGCLEKTKENQAMDLVGLGTALPFAGTVATAGIRNTDMTDPLKEHPDDGRENESQKFLRSRRPRS